MSQRELGSFYASTDMLTWLINLNNFYFVVLYVMLRFLQTKLLFLRLNPANIRFYENILKTSWSCLWSSSPDDVCKTSWSRLIIRLSRTFSEDVFNRSSRCLGQDQYIFLGHTSSRRLQDVFAKTSSRHFQDVLQTSLQDVFKTYHQVNCSC